MRFATVENSKIVSSYPMIPGIDLAGVVDIQIHMLSKSDDHRYGL